MEIMVLLIGVCMFIWKMGYNTGKKSTFRKVARRLSF